MHVFTTTIALVLLTLIRPNDAGRVLGLFPHTGRSHQMVFEPLLRELALRGHNVTVVSFFPLSNPPPNYKDLSLRGLAEIGIEVMDLALFEESEPPYLKQLMAALTFSSLADMALEVCEKLVKWPELQEVFYKDDYDVILVENFNSDCFLGLAHAYGMTAPVIALLSSSMMPWSYERLGITENPAYVASLSTDFTDSMSFLERLENTLVHYYMKYWYRNMIQVKEQAIVEKHVGRRLTDFNELAKNMSLILVNSHYSLNGGRPMVPGLIEVGGMHITSSKKPIPLHIERYMNESKHGVILFSYGSLIKTSTIPKYKEDIIVKVLSKFPQRFIWKHESSDENGTITGNILRLKWLPQRELLHHPNVKAFMAHGGLLGMSEAVNAGVPMLVTPFFGDQPANGAAAVKAGFGIVLRYQDITEESLYNAIKEVLDPQKYLNAQRLSKVWRDRPMTALDTAIYWVERTMRLGHVQNTRTTAAQLPAYQIALLDVAATLVLAILAIMLVIFAILKLAITQLFSKHSKEKTH